MKNKRLTIQRIDKFIKELSLTERVNGYSEQQKQHAIACLNNYCRELEYKERKSVKIKGEIDGSENFKSNSGTSSGIRSMLSGKLTTTLFSTLFTSHYPSCPRVQAF